MAKHVTILVGTMTGTAEIVAEEIKAMLDAETAIGSEIHPMDSLDAGILAAGGDFLIVTSTYGQGDVPDNARGFFEDVARTRPDLEQVRFAVAGLGDSTYQDTFNHAGEKFEVLLTGLGATRVAGRLKHDASGDTLAEDAAVEWARDAVASFEEARAEAA
ncbi:Cindoxin [Oceanibacterium hippocampi]|uniref:Cindoxin n=1 Tax=Oceanibacterium hippocampi TaxID=745714 RepID=A0A1Y5SCZ0_9PROT|nr:Cindoxin [Oceanibacterium hippocampi]